MHLTCLRWGFNPTPRIALFVHMLVGHEIPSASWIYASYIRVCIRVKESFIRILLQFYCIMHFSVSHLGQI